MSKRHPWLPPEIEALRKLYPDHSANFVPMCLDETPAAFIRKALALGLEESDGFWQRDASGRVQKSKQDTRMQSTQFRKGRTPEVSRNYLPIGSLRLIKDRWLERKVTDDHPVPAHRGVAEHRLTAFHSSLCQSLLREGLCVCVHNNALLFKANLCRVRGRSILTLSCRYGSHGAQCYKHHS
ncbi:hypothetical protein [Comamonas jiangduensis]|uniref:hypothetical protein n=1 Tax=Comamonas jiangduensis TaxID=1194168 RepID=UPI0028AAAB1A|nr:hypothetical protein [Comamonas jiangduensis]